MQCQTPITIKNPRLVNHPGLEGLVERFIQVPCGKCYYCQANRRSDWSFRLWCESLESLSCYFITLTYDDSNLTYADINGLSLPVLCKRDLQLFMKRLRKKYPDGNLRYFACGEYGPSTLRPHYHLLLFNYRLPDGRYRDNFHKLDTVTEDIRKIWSLGNVMVSVANMRRIGYMTKYILKLSNPVQTLDIQQPFMICSTKPALGGSFLNKVNISKLLQGNLLVCHMGQYGTLPKFYRKKLPESDQKKLSFLLKKFNKEQEDAEYELLKENPQEAEKQIQKKYYQLKLYDERLKKNKKHGLL